MRLYLVQHGEALPKERDHERHLSSDGAYEVRRMALFLSRRGVTAGRVVHSGKARAEQTALALAEAVGGRGVPVEAVEGLAPNDSTDALTDLVARIGAEDPQGSLMAVGHLPFMGKMAARLVAGDEDASVVGFRPGTVVCLEDSGQGTWVVAWMIRPELLVS